jgi:hypothetical protein
VVGTAYVLARKAGATAEEARMTLEEIRAQLQHGDQRIVALLVNRSEPHVSKVLNGTSTSAMVLAAFEALLVEREKQAQGFGAVDTRPG